MERARQTVYRLDQKEFDIVKAEKPELIENNPDVMVIPVGKKIRVKNML
ncbi:MAG TPA: hypothetical protein VK338_05830 [Candidatus Nitrosocosmicus sp.]|nr:hypothetical protein [Candidatus Nitrosocosmicus sp.]